MFLPEGTVTAQGQLFCLTYVTKLLGGEISSYGLNREAYMSFVLYGRWHVLAEET